METTESSARERDLGVAALPEERGRHYVVLCDALAFGVLRREVRAAEHARSVARLLKERCCACDIARNTLARSIQCAESSTAFHGASLATPLVQFDGTDGVSLDAAAAALEHEAEAGASVADAAAADGIEEHGGTRFVAQHVLTFLELDGELVASVHVAGIAGIAEAPGFLIARMASREREAGEGKQDLARQGWVGRYRHSGWYGQDDGEVSLETQRCMQIHREYAEKIVAKMKALHSTPPTIVPAREAEFPHLDLDSYRHYRTALEANGYRFLGDLEILDVSNATDTPMARTMIRAMLSADGTTVAGHYQVRPRMEVLTKNLVEGILNFRWFDAPASFVSHLATKQIYDFESEVGETLVTTSSAEIAGAWSTPASIDSVHLPNGTSLEAVRLAHESRLAATVARTGAVPTRMTSLVDSLAMSDRMRQQKAAHRAACGWITRDELIRLSKGNLVLADSIFEEVQEILH